MSQANPPAEQARLRNGPPRRVLVVGAGLAGLAAAYELQRAKHNVTVLEARQRPGGRVHTLREPFSDGLYAEAGASYIPDNHDLVLHYARLFGLPLVSASGRGPPTRLFYLRGQRIVPRGGEKVSWPLELPPEEQGLGPYALLKKYVRPLLAELGDVSAPGWPPERLERYDRLTFAELLRRQGASPAAVALIRVGHFDLCGDGVETVSALHMLRDLAFAEQKERTCAIQGGNDQLPRAFADRLVGQIRYGAAVQAIVGNPGGVQVSLRRGAGSETLAAERVICTVPFPVLRTIDISYPLSPMKRQAIQQLPSTSATRVYLQARTRFWGQLGEAVVANTDLPIARCFEPVYAGTVSRAMLIASTAGPQARHLGTLPEAERLAFTLTEMEKVFPGIGAEYEVGTSYCWDHDEWARGGYAWFKPGQVTSLTPYLASPEGRVHFAGDHTSAWPGWMQGALASGLRAAQEVNNAPLTEESIP